MVVAGDMIGQEECGNEGGDEGWEGIGLPAGVTGAPPDITRGWYLKSLHVTIKRFRTAIGS